MVQSVLNPQPMSVIRQKYPEYNDLSDDQLVEGFHAKFYQDMPLEEVRIRMGLDKNPYGLTDEITNSATSLVGVGGDEISAAGKTTAGNMMDFFQGKNTAPSYDENVAKERMYQSAYRDMNPITSTAAAVTGAVPFGGNAYKALLNKGMNKFLASSVMGGAGASGYGVAEGEGFQNSAENAALYGAVGALFGVGIPVGGVFAKGVLNKIRDLSPFKNVKSASIRRILRAFEDDGLTPQDAATKLEQMAASNKPGTLADIGGENLQMLGQYVTKTPGKGRQFGNKQMDKRQEAQMDRITEDVTSSISPRTNVYDISDQMIDARKLEAAPLYQKAYEKNFISSDNLDNILKRPTMLSALKKAQTEVADQGLDASAMGYRFNEAGDVIFEQAPSMQTLDQIKKSISRTVRAGQKSLNPPTNLFSLTTLERDLTRELVKLNPTYGRALSVFSNQSKSLDALDDGYKYESLAPEQITKKIAAMSPNDKEFYRIGVARKVLDVARAKGDTANKAVAIFGSPKKREALRPLFASDAAFKKFEQNMKYETSMFDTYRKVTTGSPTTPLLNEGEALSGDALNFGRSAIRADIPGMIGSSVRGITERFKGNTPRTSEQISKILLQNDPKALRQFIKSLTQQAERPPSKIGQGVGLFSRGIPTVTPLLNRKK